MVFGKIKEYATIIFSFCLIHSFIIWLIWFWYFKYNSFASLFFKNFTCISYHVPNSTCNTFEVCFDIIHVNVVCLTFWSINTM